MDVLRNKYCLKVILFLSLFLLPLNGNTYQIGPYSIGFDPVHEALTISSLNCLENNESLDSVNCIEPIQNCIDSSSEASRRIIRECFERSELDESNYIFMNEYSLEDIEQAVRWPDDPTREERGRSLLNVVKFSFKMLSYCERILKKRGNNGETLNMNDGFLCNSHLGQNQFWHAQSSTLEETSEQTYKKILDWAMFNYQVATSVLDQNKSSILNEDYCRYFNELNESSISKSMVPEQYFGCNERPFYRKGNRKHRYLERTGVYRAYKLSTLYNFTCSNFFGSTFCTEITDEEEAEKKSAISAIGALLHLVQDSFSKSHIERWEVGERNESPVSAIECKEAKVFTNFAQYNFQTAQVYTQPEHKPADRWPLIADNCILENREVDDPVTASAKILWHIQNSSSDEAFIRDFERAFCEVPEGLALGVQACFIGGV